MARGGKRPGAGRPRKDRSKQDFFETAEDYLLAVVQGQTVPDQVRVQAAKTLISYQLPKKRTKPKSPTPKELQKKEESSIERNNLLEFEKKAAVIRAKYEKRSQ